MNQLYKVIFSFFIGLNVVSSLSVSIQKLNYKLSIISVSLLSLQQPVVAQIPTFDEYNTGSGTLIKPKISSSSAQRNSLKQIEQGFNKETLKNTLINIKNDITGGLWDDVLLQIKQIAFINKSNYGLDKVLNESINNDREELKYLISEISDIALASRIIYFNIEDLKGVELLTNDDSKEQQKEAIKEASENIDKALKLFSTIQLDF